ncbi:hypothetical protein EZV62_003436 [Acer yangbiense]|uniref:CRM domain-containing protein n=1 Tax=Acer yangbiense TaxID=1000413 RepID=A0A5C7IH77_9ROSI|nr:hypothetical protein EZV62_003436 [Acer yangbiense]
MPQPWTGKQPLKKSKKKIPLFDSFDPPPPGKKGVKYVELPGPYPFGKYPKEAHSREEILGEPLKKWEISMLVKPMLSDNLDKLILEKTGGKIIHRVGGVVYIFRGRNYNCRTHPQYPLMLWKPAAPVYPKLIQEAPEGLTKDEVDDLRKKGKSLLPICKLAKNGVYTTLVKDVKNAFEGSSLVKIDCKGLHASDYKKLGAKLKCLMLQLLQIITNWFLACYCLLTFDDEQILMWRGKNWKSMYPEGPAIPQNFDTAGGLDGSETVRLSPKMMSLWKRAIESSKALLLDEINLGPDDLLKKVEEFENISQATEHSYPALVLSSEDGTSSSTTTSEYEESENYSDSDIYPEDDIDDDEYYDSDTLVPIGSLPVDQIAKRLRRK